MSETPKPSSSLVQVGSSGLVKAHNALRVTENLVNSYDSVVIGGQEWMARNLNVSRFRNGDVIPQKTDAQEWKIASNEGTPACCFTEASENGRTYGRLYNWHAINDPRGLAPKGWRIPNYDDWRNLVVALGGSKTAGQKMRSGNSQFWEPSNVEGTNESGFTGEPFGERNCVGTYMEFGWQGFWWISNERDARNARCISLFFAAREVKSKVYNKCFGLSVRCVREK